MRTIQTIICIICGIFIISCNNQSQYINRVYTFQKDSKTVAIQLFDDGKAATSTFYNLKKTIDKSLYIWDGKYIDTLSYNIDNNEVSLYTKGNLFAKFSMEDNEHLNLRVNAGNGSFNNITVHHDMRFTSFDHKNEYTGEAYECITISEKGVELIFVTSDRVIARPIDGFTEGVNDYQLGEYKVTEDNSLIIKLKNERVELIPEKNNLKLNLPFENFTFRKNKYKPNIWDALEAEMIYQEAKEEYERYTIKKYEQYTMKEYGGYTIDTSTGASTVVN